MNMPLYSKESLDGQRILNYIHLQIVRMRFKMEKKYYIISRQYNILQSIWSDDQLIKDWNVKDWKQNHKYNEKLTG